MVFFVWREFLDSWEGRWWKILGLLMVVMVGVVRGGDDE